MATRGSRRRLRCPNQQRGILRRGHRESPNTQELAKSLTLCLKTPKSLPSNKARISPRYSPTAKSTRSSVPPNHLLFLTSSTVERLFENFKQVEADYYKRTGIFPTIHAVALKRSAYEANPWIAKTLTKAFAQSLDMAYEPLRERAALRYMLPWLEEHVEQTEELMGDSKWWIDGFTENKHVIEGFLDYHFKQGLSKRRFKAEEIFTPNALEAFVV
jgi:hypothetical protein